MTCSETHHAEITHHSSWSHQPRKRFELWSRSAHGDSSVERTSSQPRCWEKTVRHECQNREDTNWTSWNPVLMAPADLSIGLQKPRGKPWRKLFCYREIFWKFQKQLQQRRIRPLITSFSTLKSCQRASRAFDLDLLFFFATIVTIGRFCCLQNVGEGQNKGEKYHFAQQCILCQRIIAKGHESGSKSCDGTCRGVVDLQGTKAKTFAKKNIIFKSTMKWKAVCKLVSCLCFPEVCMEWSRWRLDFFQESAKNPERCCLFHRGKLIPLTQWFEGVKNSDFRPGFHLPVDQVGVTKNLPKCHSCCNFFSEDGFDFIP